MTSFLPTHSLAKVQLFLYKPLTVECCLALVCVYDLYPFTPRKAASEVGWPDSQLLRAVQQTSLSSTLW